MTATEHDFEFSGFRVQVERRRFLAPDGAELALSSRAFDLLLYLIEHRGEDVGKTELMKTVWPDTVVEENNLTQAIHAIRRALGDSRAQGRFLLTIPGRGYRFIAPVRAVGSAESAAISHAAEPARQLDAAEPVPPSPEPEAAVEAAAMPRPPATKLATLENVPVARWWPWPRWTGLIGAAVMLVAVALGAALVQGRRSETTASVPTPAYGSPARIAVLPFENLSPNTTDAFFAEGLHADVIAALGQRFPELDVISRTTMMGYRGEHKSTPRIAQELGVSHVLEGSVRREDDHIRLTLQLLDARTDRMLWSQTYDRTLGSALALQSEIATAVATRLSVSAKSPVADHPVPTSSPEAYDLYLKALLARDGLLGAATLPEVVRQIELPLSAAILRDPSFALAYAARASVLTYVVHFNIESDERVLERARADLEAAERIAPKDPRVQMARANYVLCRDGLPAAALAAISSTQLTDPLDLVSQAILLTSVGRIEEGDAVARRALALDPENPGVRIGYASQLSALGRHVDGIRVLDAGIRELPANPALKMVRAMLVFRATGDVEEWTRQAMSVGDQFAHSTAVNAEFDRQRLLHHYDELDGFLERFGTRAPLGSAAFMGVGAQPIAELRGWTSLLAGDRAKADARGREVLEFVASSKELPRSAFFLRLLTAEGYTFRGDSARAIAAADEALRLMPRSRDGFSWVVVAQIAGWVYAWNGEHARASALFAELAKATPGLPPAMIARDPLVSVPLGRDEKYLALVAQLESSMASDRQRLAGER